MSSNNKFIHKIERTKTELEAKMNMRPTEFKSGTVSSIDIKLSVLNKNKSPSSYDQPSADLIKCPLLKSLEKYFHASNFTKHPYYIIVKSSPPSIRILSMLSQLGPRI